MRMIPLGGRQIARGDVKSDSGDEGLFLNEVQIILYRGVSFEEENHMKSNSLHQKRNPLILSYRSAAVRHGMSEQNLPKK